MQRMMTWLLEEYLGYDRVEWRWSSWPSVRRGGERGWSGDSPLESENSLRREEAVVKRKIIK